MKQKNKAISTRVNQLFMSLGLALAIVVSFISPVYASNANNFYFKSFQADYYLSKDSEGRSTMNVVENLTAQFPDYNQNKGIVRSIPLIYDGHTVSFKLISLERNGQSENIYDETTEDNSIEISTGTEEYLTGTQVYTFTYTLRDVTKSFDGHQELYWDTNGTGWTQQFDSVDATVHLSDSVASSFTGDMACYQGESGSKEKCNFTKINDKTYGFSATHSLGSYENMTFVMGFDQGTFAGYNFSVNDFLNLLPEVILPFIFFLIVGVVIIILIISKKKQKGITKAKKQEIIIPEYTPPKGVSLMELSLFYGSSYAPSVIVAQIIDLAVRKKIRIVEAEAKILGVFGKKKYSLELLDVNDLNAAEIEFIEVLFNDSVVGSKCNVNDNDAVRSQKIMALRSSLRQKMQALGYVIYSLTVSMQNILLTTLFIIEFILILVIILIFFGAIFGQNNIWTPMLFMCGMVIILIPMLVKSFKQRKGVLNLSSGCSLTPEGYNLYLYLQGLRMYIELAEIDRIKYLQSPQGAEREPIDVNDSAQMVKLYERLLPYAILFGQEKEWSKQLQVYYTQSNIAPVWYSGVVTFDAASFADSLGSFSSSISNSSSSGLGGGGFSGGGGGGGGGGGR